MVDMLDPGGGIDLTDRSKWPRILDPACGSGRFLTYALDHIRRRLAEEKNPEYRETLRDLLTLVEPQAEPKPVAASMSKN